VVVTDNGHESGGEVGSIYREIEKVVPIRSLHAFLLVAQKEGLSVNEYAQRAGVCKSMMSRTLHEISDLVAREDGLVTSRRQPMNLRRKEVFLTLKGHEAARCIDEVVACNLTVIKSMFARRPRLFWLKLLLACKQGPNEMARGSCHRERREVEGSSRG
jgi:DNA-binding MarR family transcriptional regulator